MTGTWQAVGPRGIRKRSGNRPRLFAPTWGGTVKDRSGLFGTVPGPRPPMSISCSTQNNSIARKLTEKAKEVFEALRAIHPEHFFNEGRVYGGGLHKMEPAELMRLPADRIAKVLGVKAQQQASLF